MLPAAAVGPVVVGVSWGLHCLQRPAKEMRSSGLAAPAVAAAAEEAAGAEAAAGRIGAAGSEAGAGALGRMHRRMPSHCLHSRLAQAWAVTYLDVTVQGQNLGPSCWPPLHYSSAWPSTAPFRTPEVRVHLQDA